MFIAEIVVKYRQIHNQRRKELIVNVMDKKRTLWSSLALEIKNIENLIATIHYNLERM